MGATSNDPAQLLAKLLKGGQAIFGNPGAPNDSAAAGSDAASSDPMNLYIAYTQQMLQAQRSLLTR